MINTQLRKTFETTPMKIMVEEISFSKSAFAVNEKGDSVFINARLVKRMGLDYGDILVGHCIPNYEDKRDHTPWRCIQVEKIENLCH